MKGPAKGLACPLVNDELTNPTDHGMHSKTCCGQSPAHVFQWTISGQPAKRKGLDFRLTPCFFWLPSADSNHGPGD